MTIRATISQTGETHGGCPPSDGLVPWVEIRKTELDTVQNELHSDGRQHETHQSGQDAHSGLAEPPLDERRRRQYEIAEQRGEKDRDVNRRGRGRRFRAERERHHGGDSSGPREHRYAEGHNADVVFLIAFSGLDWGLALLAAARLHHVERIQAHEHAASDLECPDGDPEDPEDYAAAQGERRERNGAGPRAPPREHAALLRRVACRHRKEGGDDCERVDDEENRRENQEQVHHAAAHDVRSVRSLPERRDPSPSSWRHTSPDRPVAAGRRCWHRSPHTTQRRYSPSRSVFP